MHLAEILKLQALTQVESKPSDGLQQRQKIGEMTTRIDSLLIQFED